jgi:hypothetical protein
VIKIVQKKFFTIKLTAFILDLIAAAFVAWGQHYFIAIIIFIVSISLLIIFLRCPYCGYRFDPRFKMSDNTHCPNCGKVLFHESKIK